MRHFMPSIALAAAMATVMPAALADNDDRHGDNVGRKFNVTITNVTRGQTFTPILVVSHAPASNLIFTPGATASPELAILAESGNPAPLAAMLKGDPRFKDSAASVDLLDPRFAVTVPVRGRPGRDHISLAAMLIPTNDAFVSIQNVPLPAGRDKVTVFASAYDAGSEPNDERCASIPGPVCGGEGLSGGSGEGFVHVHAGIHGIGDLVAADRDWRNPVAVIVIQRAD